MTPQEQNQLELPVVDEVSLPPMFEGRQKTQFLEPFIVLAKHKFLILYAVAATAVASLIVALLIPWYYTANTKILPPQQGQGFASAMMDQIGALAPLLSAAGGKDLLKNPNDLYVAMLHSRTVADDVIDRFALMKVYGKKRKEDTRKRLNELTEIVAGKDGVISVAVEDRDPQRASDMANFYIIELEKLTKTLAITDAAKRRIFFEREAKVAQEQLEAAELELKKTQEATGIIQLDSQSKVIFQAYADLKAEATEKQIEIDSMRSYATADNPDLLRLEHERDALRSQIAAMEKGQGGPPIGDVALERVPERALKYLDKAREVGYRNALLQLLLKQYEAARVDEARDYALIQVLDPALRPEKKSWPIIWIVVLISSILALLLAIGWACLKEAIEHSREDPQHLAQWQLLKFYLSRGQKSEKLG